jgi:formate dehydrogenase maturation protein FdhE
MKLTPTQYVRKYAATLKTHCPSCGSEYDVFAVNDANTEEGMIIHYECGACYTEWDETYKLTGYINLREG